jgi:HD-GYP domain-containing protein (c-di-GMP phosphodiesterase class II)
VRAHRAREPHARHRQGWDPGQRAAQAGPAHQILANSDSELLRLGALLSLTHHERFDGLGYPHGLAGEDIPLAARVVAVADVFDALTSDRVYRPAMTIDEALELMRGESGFQFDPDVFRAFLSALDTLIEIRTRSLGSAPVRAAA